MEASEYKIVGEGGQRELLAAIREAKAGNYSVIILINGVFYDVEPIAKS